MAVVIALHAPNPFAEAGPCHLSSVRGGFDRFMAEPSASLPNDATARSRGSAASAEDANQRVADGQLMRRAAAGDEAAFASFYRRFAPGVYSMIHQILQDPKECEDVMQEAFVQMWKKASTYDPSRSALFTWAVMISRNKAIDRVRSRQRRARTIEAATVEAEVVTPAAAEGADELLNQSDERKRVRAALSTLTGAQRAAIDLAFFSGMTQLEISDKLGEPLGTVKARIRRGLLALRGVLETRSS
jgi:RNA polymerase sigma-70 factor (ECF subfamily)